MDSSKKHQCPKCDQIAREINEALVRMLQATDADLKVARKEAARALEAKREHELRTGHSGPS